MQPGVAWKAGRHWHVILYALCFVCRLLQHIVDHGSPQHPISFTMFAFPFTKTPHVDFSLLLQNVTRVFPQNMSRKFQLYPFDCHYKCLSLFVFSLNLLCCAHLRAMEFSASACRTIFLAFRVSGRILSRIRWHSILEIWHQFSCFLFVMNDIFQRLNT